jgi:hypothetical protein
MGLVEAADFSAAGWSAPEKAEPQSRRYCGVLEEGGIVLFRQTPFPIPEAHRSFLLGVRQPNTAHHKNVSYKPGQNRVLGFARGSADETALAGIMRDYSRAVCDFVNAFLLPYAGHWQLDYASFRPIEEEGRDLPVSKRNDLLHVDSFPTRPSNGNRILRVFTNLNPVESRIWLTSEPFEVWAKQYGDSAGLPQIAARSRSPAQRLRRRGTRLVRALGIPLTDRPPYDEFMLDFHHFMKSNRSFQNDSPKYRWEFPSGATWLVFTDMVPHAVLSGRFALEQTFFVSRDALLQPERAPCEVLERLAGTPLTD